MKTQLSIIIPVFNAGIYLHKCLNSILAQSYSDFELLLIDDGSTDKSPEILKQFAEKDSRIKYLSVSNSGPAAARNIGLSNANGKYITFVDADDYISDPMHYEKLIMELENSSVDGVITNWTQLEEATGEKTSSNISYSGKYPADFILQNVFSDDVIGGGGYPWNKVFKRESLLDHNGQLIRFEENVRFYEDKLWVIRVLANCKQIYLLNEYGYVYLNRKDSLSHKNAFERLKDELQAVSLLVDLNKELNNDSDEIHARLNDLLIDLTYFAFRYNRNILTREILQKSVFPINSTLKRKIKYWIIRAYQIRIACCLK